MSTASVIKSRISDKYLKVPEAKKLICGETRYFGTSTETKYTNYGRVPQKPEYRFDPENPRNANVQEQLTIQDHIENIRIKIGLKDRHLKVLREEFEESKTGAHVVIIDLHEETTALRRRLVDALNSEKIAVQNALRTQREFQLALHGKPSAEAIAWIRDRIYQVTNRLNLALYELEERRKKLEDAEEIVQIIELDPPCSGCSAWERKQMNINQRIEIDIDKNRVKRETISVLLTRFKWIKEFLENEKPYYQPTLESQTKQLETLKAEISGLESMLRDASQFNENAINNLVEIEKEATDNRRLRRKQLRRMRRSVQELLEENHEMSKKSQTIAFQKRKIVDVSESRAYLDDQEEMVREKQRLVELFQQKAERLVAHLRVPNLTYIPGRIEYMDNLNDRLEDEACNKEKLRNFLIKQRDQLLLILCHFKYTGLQEYQLFMNRKTQLEIGIEATIKDTKECEIRLHEYGQIMQNARIGIISIIELLENRKRHRPAEQDIDEVFTRAKEKLKKLVDRIAEIKGLFGDKPAERDYAPYMKQVYIPPRYVRAKTSEEIDEPSDAEVDEQLEGDYKVPSREEIKKDSQRYIHQAIMKGVNPRRRLERPKKSIYNFNYSRTSSSYSGGSINNRRKTSIQVQIQSSITKGDQSKESDPTADFDTC